MIHKLSTKLYFPEEAYPEVDWCQMAGASSINVSYLDVSVFVHATEDESKVEKALRNMVPDTIRDYVFKRQGLSGHHSDPLTILSIKIRRKGAGEMLNQIIGSLTSLDQQRILDELEDRVDESGNLYIRLDKQKAFHGKAVLNEIDPIRLKFHIQIPHGIEVDEHVRAALSEVIDKTGGDEP